MAHVLTGASQFTNRSRVHSSKRLRAIRKRSDMGEPKVAQTEVDQRRGRGVGRGKGRTAHWLAWSLGILCVALLASSLLFLELARIGSDDAQWKADTRCSIIR